MKIGLIADIHANAHALEAVLKSAKKKNVEKLLCCGDYVGYYYEPDIVMDLLDDWDWDGVSGNHEEMLSDWLNGIKLNEIKMKYGTGISHAAEKLTHEKAAHLYELPNITKLNIDNYKIVLCHGSPWERDVYIYPDADKQNVDKMFNHDPDFDLMIYGHTHYPVKWVKNNKIIINPGSLGQPRDRKQGACWALWDTAMNSVEFFREEYDFLPVIEMCKQYDPELSYLVDILVST